MPLVSVVMPVYNSQRFLAEAIECILNQTFTDFEFLIIDDGSTDTSSDILATYAKRDERIRIYTHTKNLGIAEARNLGLKLAKGKYVATMDSDDLVLPERLQLQVAYMESHPDTGVLGAGAYIIDEKGKRRGVLDYPSSHPIIIHGLCFYDPINNPVVMVRREVVLSVGGYNPEFPPTEDYDLWVRLSSVTFLANLPERLLFLRKHGSNTTSEKHEINCRQSIDVNKNMIKSILGYKPEITPHELAWLPRRITADETRQLRELIINIQEYFLENYQLAPEDQRFIHGETALQLFKLLRYSALNTVALSAFLKAIIAEPHSGIVLFRRSGFKLQRWVKALN
jgi:glycosyltransferase involved in cell wall biosynthesis